jgi:hypothetical protein
LLKEILWTKSTGLWIDERAPVHGSTVDRASYPFGVLIWGAPFGFNGWDEGGAGVVVTTGGAAGAHGGAVAGEAPEWPSGGQRLAVNSPGGRGVDEEPISRGGRAREG